MDDGLELSEAKTKRKIINLLSNYQWLYQYSLFCDVHNLEYDEAKHVAMSWIHDFQHRQLRDYLRKTTNTAILFVIRAGIIKNRPDNKRIRQIFLTMYCNEPLNLDIRQKYSPYYINEVHRRISKNKIVTTCNAIRNQALHDLSTLNGMKRYSVINKSLLIPKEIDE